MVIIVDDKGRENEGDLVMAAEKVTPEAINFMVFCCFLKQLRSDPTLTTTWFQRMRDHTILPDHITLSTIMSAAPTARLPFV